MRAALAGRELEVLTTVREAYLAHARNQTSLPHSTLLRFPGHDANRIIALPAFPPGRVGLVGTGLINREIVGYLCAAVPGITRLVLYDIDQARARSAGARLRESHPELEVELASGIDQVLGLCSVVSFATTAMRPHVGDLSHCARGSVILHVSHLESLSPQSRSASIGSRFAAPY